MSDWESIKSFIKHTLADLMLAFVEDAIKDKEKR
tara:strand:+ start:398 stop:499 length:102 start_codon:yes stop_codon:yes gene_type:complete